MPLNKRLILIFIFLFLTIFIGWALYVLFFRAPSPSGPYKEPITTPSSSTLPISGPRSSSTATGQTPGPSTLPTSTVILTGPDQNQNYYQREGVTQVTDDISTHPSITKDGNLRYHNAANGIFYKINPDGTISPLSDQVFYNVSNVTWAKSADKAVVEYPDGTKTIYNFETNQQTTLPNHWTDFTFSPDSETIAAKSMGLAPENRWLVTANDDGTGTKLVEPLGENGGKVTMTWSPSGQTVAFSQTGNPQGADRKEILLIGLNGENFKSIITEGLDFQSQWSPTGERLLYSVDSSRSEFKPELWIVNSYGDQIGSERRMLEVNTWANKCTFVDDSAIICAIPRSLPVGAGMAPSLAADIPDDLYRIDTRTGLRTYIPLDANYTFDSISYDSANNQVYFTDHHRTGVFTVGL